MTKKKEVLKIIAALHERSALVREAWTITRKEGLATDTADVEKDLRRLVSFLNQLLKLSPDDSQVGLRGEWDDFQTKITSITEACRLISGATGGLVKSQVDPNLLNKVQVSAKAVVRSIRELSGDVPSLLTQTRDAVYAFDALSRANGNILLAEITGLLETISSGLEDIVRDLQDTRIMKLDGTEVGILSVLPGKADSKKPSMEPEEESDSAPDSAAPTETGIDPHQIKIKYFGLSKKIESMLNSIDIAYGEDDPRVVTIVTDFADKPTFKRFFRFDAWLRKTEADNLSNSQLIDEFPEELKSAEKFFPAASAEADNLQQAINALDGTN